MNAAEALHALVRLDACREARAWVGQFGPDTEWQDVWNACPRGDWMMWLLGHVAGGSFESEARKKLVSCACDCAELSLPFCEQVWPDDARPRRLLEAVRGHLNGSFEPDALNDAIWQCYVAYNASNLERLSYLYRPFCATGKVLRMHFTGWSLVGEAHSSVPPDYLAAATDVVRRHYPQAPDLSFLLRQEVSR